MKEHFLNTQLFNVINNRRLSSTEKLQEVKDIITKITADNESKSSEIEIYRQHYEMKAAHIDAQSCISKDTALILAIYYRDSNVAKLLLRQGASPHIVNKNNETALYWASRKNLISVVRLLLEKKSNINAQDKNGDTALVWAARNKHKEIFQLLLDHNATNGEIPLHFASRENHIEIVQLLLENKVDVNTQNHEGNTALILAAYNKHLEIVELLLKHHADPNLSNKNGETPLYWAATKDQTYMFRLLLGANADPHSGLLLQSATRAGNTEIVQLLLERKPDINAQNNYGDTALHWAAYNGNKEIVRLLLDVGADINLINKVNETSTPYDVAVNQKHTEIAEMLRKASSQHKSQRKKFLEDKSLFNYPVPVWNIIFEYEGGFAENELLNPIQTIQKRSLVMASIAGLVGLAGLLTTAFTTQKLLAAKIFYPILAIEIIASFCMVFAAYKVSNSKETSNQTKQNLNQSIALSIRV